MVQAFNDNLDVTPDGAWKTYLDQEIAANNAAVAQADEWAAAFTAQSLIYFALWDDAIDNRDDVIDDMEDFNTYVEDKSATVDYPQMQLKQTVLTALEVPDLNTCTDPIMWLEENQADGEVVDSEASKQARRACGGAPAGWDMHEGQLYASAAAVYAGGLVHNANKRRIEGFRRNKTALVQRAQSAARLATGPILAGYQQAAAIHEGLSGIFLQGFQSAGAGLGVSLDRLSQANNGNLG